MTETEVRIDTPDELVVAHKEKQPIGHRLGRIVLGPEWAQEHKPPAKPEALVLRDAKRRRRARLLGGLVVGSVFINGLTNRDSLQVVRGLQADSPGMQQPQVACMGAEQVAPDSVTHQEVPKAIPKAPQPDRADNDVALSIIQHSQSSAHEMGTPSLLDMGQAVVDYYNGYFDHKVAEHTSTITGNRYEIYAFGGELELLNLDVIEQTERALLYAEPDFMLESDAKRLACIREVILSGKHNNSLPLPIVIAARPACLGNMRVHFLKSQADEDAHCQQAGATTPVADANLFGIDVSPQDHMMLLTTDDYDDYDYDTILFAHELWHKLVEQAQGDEYAFNLNGEERYVLYIVNSRLAGSDGFADIPPLATLRRADGG